MKHAGQLLTNTSPIRSRHVLSSRRRFSSGHPGRTQKPTETVVFDLECSFQTEVEHERAV